MGESFFCFVKNAEIRGNNPILTFFVVVNIDSMVYNAIDYAKKNP